MKTRHGVRMAAALSVLVGLVAACGDDDDETTTTDSPVATTAAPASTAAAPTSSASGDTTAPADATDDAAWAEVVAAAEAEGKVVVYSVLVPDINDRLAAAFSEQYPAIDIEIIRVLGNEIDAKLEAEKTTGADGADLVANVNYPWALTASGDGSLAPIAGPNATGAPWAGTEFVIGGNVQLVTFSNIGIGWNTEAVPEGLTSFEDLLKPEYAGGKIGLTDPIAPVVADFYATLEDNYGPEFVEQLAAQQPVFFPGAVPLEQALAAGEIAVGGYVTNVGITAAKAEGAPVEFVLPENAWAPPIMAYIPTWSQRPNAAQVLMDFMASPEGQAVLGQNSFSPIDGIEGTAGDLDSVSVSNVQRAVEPGWYDTYYANWKTIFGR